MMSGRTPVQGVSRTADAGDDHPTDDSRPRAATDPDVSVGRQSGGFDGPVGEQAEDDRHANSLVRTLRFVYRHSTALVPASVLWVVCSLPLVTIGPASLGVYSVVLSLRETGRVDRSRVVRTVRENLVPAVLLGFLPVLFVGTAALYVVSGLATGLVGTALTGGALYAGLYLGVLLIPTFVSVAGGVEPKTALRESYVWLAGAPATGLQLLLATVVVLVATLGLTVGFLLLFAGIAATYHVEVIANAAEEDDGVLPGVSATEGDRR